METKKLKTLKQIEEENTPSPADEVGYFCNDLREVAREWIDRMLNGYCYCHEEDHMNEWKDDIECVMCNDIVLSWIRMFFNLNEDE